MKAPRDEKKTALLGYPDLYVTVSDPSEPQKYDVHIVPRMDNSKCPHCGKTAQSKGSHKLKKLDYIVDNGNVAFIDVNLYRRRFFCMNCERHPEKNNDKNSPSFSEPLPAYNDKKISLRLAQYFYFLYCAGKTERSIGKPLKLSFNTIYRALEDVRETALDLEGYPQPEEVFMKEVVVHGERCTVICDVDRSTVVYFAWKPANDVLDPHYKGRSEQEQRQKDRLDDIISSAETIIVDTDCCFLSNLNGKKSNDCEIRTDPTELYRKLYADFEQAVYQKLQGERAKKFLRYVPMDFSYPFTEQKEYSFVRRALDASDELNEAFSALNAFRHELGRSTIGDEYMDFIKLESYLKSTELLVQELSTNLFQGKNRETDEMLKECRDFLKFLVDELEKMPKEQTPEAVEGKFYYCVPRCYECTPYSAAEGSRDKRLVSVSSFEQRPLGTEMRYEYIGKTFDSIMANVRYREEVINGKRSYVGPEIL